MPDSTKRIDEMAEAARFYVYELIDPRDGKAFYIGKGQGRRIYGHEAEAAKGVHGRKCSRIREIWQSGEQVVRRIVSRHTDENDALQAEYDLIEKVGLDNLTNVLPGGRIGQEAYARILEQRAARREAEEGECLRAHLRDIAPQFAMLLRAISRGGQIGAWVGPRWIDATEAFNDWLKSIASIVGWDEVAAVLKPYDIEVRATNGDQKAALAP